MEGGRAFAQGRKEAKAKREGPEGSYMHRNYCYRQ